MLIPPEERRHVDLGAREGEQPGGAGTVDVVVLCGGGDADQVLGRAREVLRIVVDHQAGRWPSLEEWRELLPSWFLSACSEEMAQEQAEAWLERWRTLTPEEQRLRLSRRSGLLRTGCTGLNPTNVNGSGGTRRSRPPIVFA